MVIVDRMTRRNEGPGERHEGRRSSTPIIYQLHLEGCSRARGRKALTESEATVIVGRDCKKPRHLMTCLECESMAVADKIKSDAF